MIKVTVIVAGWSPQDFICDHFYINDFGYLVINGLCDNHGIPVNIAVFKEFQNIVNYGDFTPASEQVHGSTLADS